MKLPYPMRPLRWVGSSKKDFDKLPRDVQGRFGFSLFRVQLGDHPAGAKPLKTVGQGVLELIERFDTDTFRAVYAICFDEAVYVLHVFQKKSPKGIKTAHIDIDLIRKRLKAAAHDHAANTASK